MKLTDAQRNALLLLANGATVTLCLVTGRVLERHKLVSWRGYQAESGRNYYVITPAGRRALEDAK